MDFLISAMILIGEILIALAGLIVVLVGGWFAWAAVVRAGVKHEPVEYYRGWDGYTHPISLTHKISKDEADALHAEGSVYLIGRYHAHRLTRATKMLKGEVFFDFEYSYHPNGTCESVKTTNAKGVVKVRRYDRRGRPEPDNPSGFW
jgi:hypothetical protein